MQAVGRSYAFSGEIAALDATAAEDPDQEPPDPPRSIDMTTIYQEPEAPPREQYTEPEPDTKREWTLVGLGLVGLVAVLGVVLATFAFATGASEKTTTVQAPAAAAPAADGAAATATAPTLAQSKGVAFEKFEWVDPTLPEVPAGPVKKFTVDVDEHNVQVKSDLAPTKAWTYTVNGKIYKGTAASPPIVVNQGDKVAIKFVNGGSKAMNVSMGHSIDFHSAEVDPSTYYVDVAPGKTKMIRFTADHPGVFMYHCATQPVLMHVGNGMAGMMVVKPKGLAPVDRELWVAQGEYYLGKPGAPADMNKLNAGTPDVIAFNGYADQYKTKPISVRQGERIRMYVLNEGPTKWSAFHVIGTIFDKVRSDNGVAHSVQTINLAPSQGAYAEFTLAQEGSYPFVNHSFGDMVQGAAGILQTANAPQNGGEGAAPAAAPATHDMGGGEQMAGHDMGGGTEKAAAGAGNVDIALGDMWIKSSAPEVRAGKVSFAVGNEGATMHQFAIVPAPAKVVGGTPDVTSAVAKGKMLSGGESETVAADLKPGNYELVCIMAGHYAAGQKLAFTVR
jgi:FtsP/CotA-like multicopper oxidase with cupredoxin domain